MDYVATETGDKHIRIVLSVKGAKLGSYWSKTWETINCLQYVFYR